VYPPLFEIWLGRRKIAARLEFRTETEFALTAAGDIRNSA
jgi:hypothetical protein